LLAQHTLGARQIDHRIIGSMGHDAKKEHARSGAAERSDARNKCKQLSF
jgi:hypothetical protein